MSKEAYANTGMITNDPRVVHYSNESALLKHISPILQREGVTHAHHHEEVSNKRVDFHKIMGLAASGEETAMKRVQEYIFSSANKMIPGLAEPLQKIIPNKNVTEELNLLTQNQITFRLADWVSLQIQKNKLGNNQPSFLMHGFSRRIVMNARTMLLFHEITAGNSDALTLISSETEKMLHKYVVEKEQEYILEDAQIKLNRALPGFIERQLERNDLLGQNLNDSLKSYVRSIPHSMIIDKKRRQEVLGRQIDPKPLHDIRYVLPDFPKKDEKESELLYQQRLEKYLHSIGVPTGNTVESTGVGLRTTIMSLRTQGASYKELAKFLNTSQNIESLATTAYYTRQQIETFILPSELLPINSHEFRETPYNISQKALANAIKKSKCEGMDFMGFYTKKAWVIEYLQNKDRRVKRQQV